MSIQLSVCMIIKNESSTLKKCLSSVQPIADELIIVDTGSTDNSKEIAREFTSHVYDYTWEDDFSKARNESIKYATGKWILIIDADEYIAPADIDSYKNFFEFTEPSPNLVYSITVNSFLESAISNIEVSRIFPNRLGFHFHRPIHEQLTNKTPEKLRSANSNLNLYHSGYLPETIKMKKKSERNMAIFDKLKQQGKLSSYDHFTLANEYSVRNNVARAFYHYKRSFKTAKLNNPWRLICGYRLFYIYSEANRLDKAGQVLSHMFEESSTFPDEYYLRATIYNKLGFTELAKQNCELAYELANDLANDGQRFFLINAELTSLLPLTMLLNIAKDQKNYKDIIYYSTKLLQADRRNINAISSIVNTLITHNEAHNITSLFDNILGKRTVLEEIIILRCCLNMGYADIVSTIKIPENFEIPTDSQLLISLIKSNKELFNASIKKLNSDNINDNILTSILIGSLVWNDNYYDSIQHQLQHKYVQLDQLYNIIYYNHSYDLTNKKLQNSIVDFLIMLFVTRNDRLFNKYIEQFNDSNIINRLGEFFYINNFTDISLAYFSNLIKNDALDKNNSFLLGQLHLNKGYVEDAIHFYQHVIELDPSIIQAYIKIITNTQDVQLHSLIKEKLFLQYPKLKALGIINNY